MLKSDFSQRVDIQLLLQDKLEARESKVKAILTHPGGSWTAITANSASHSPGSFLDSKFAMRIMKMFVQGQGDGALPMLASATDPAAASGDFYCPSVVGVIGMVRLCGYYDLTHCTRFPATIAADCNLLIEKEWVWNKARSPNTWV